jgi:hypothetical protein
MNVQKHCPDCEAEDFTALNRRRFVQTVGAAAAAVSLAPAAVVYAGVKRKPKPETLVKKLYDSLTPKQKETIAFDWDYNDKSRGLLRTHVSNNWQITKPKINSSFFTKDQQQVIEAIFDGLYNPDWRDRIRKQLQDDARGYGKSQSIALFGQPGTGKFEFVMTGRHLTIRCDGDSAGHVAFGGPIFYGHAAQDFDEKKNHPGNVFWHQALKANAVFKMLDGKQRKQALVPKAPLESQVGFQGSGGKLPGIRLSELSNDQVEHVNGVLKSLLEPYRASDQREALACLKAQGGLEKCSIAFYQSDDIGEDGVWDIWRLEGPAFVWHWRGAPHVHVWVNIANDPAVKTNAVV